MTTRVDGAHRLLLEMLWAQRYCGVAWMIYFMVLLREILNCILNIDVFLGFLLEVVILKELWYDSGDLTLIQVLKVRICDVAWAVQFCFRFQNFDLCSEIYAAISGVVRQNFFSITSGRIRSI